MATLGPGNVLFASGQTHWDLEECQQPPWLASLFLSRRESSRCRLMCQGACYFVGVLAHIKCDSSPSFALPSKKLSADAGQKPLNKGEYK